MLEGFSKKEVVIINLINPKEKFWGVLVSLTAVGLTLRGINLDSFDDWVRQVSKKKEDEQTLDLVTMFVPLFRVERVFLDEAVGSVQSYSQIFERLVGTTPQQYLGLDSSEEKLA